MGSTSKMRRGIQVLGVLLGLVFVAWVVVSGFVAWEMTRRVRPPFDEPAPQVGDRSVEPHRLTTSDGEEIGAWLLRRNGSRGCVLLLHGMDASRRAMVPLMDFLAENKFSSLAITLRAHGDSTGETLDFGYGSRHEVIAAVEFLQRELPGQPIYVLGRSLGAAAALFAAEELGGRVAGYFLECPYLDLETATWRRTQEWLPPVLDWAAYLGLRLWSGAFLPVSASEISPCRCAALVPGEVPVVLVCGSEDRELPPSDAREIFRQVESHGKFVLFEGAGHATLYGDNPSLYQETLLELLGK